MAGLQWRLSDHLALGGGLDLAWFLSRSDAGRELAATAAGISGEEGQAAAPPNAQATVDEGLTTWFSQQSPDPPLGPDVYAGRVGRLRPDLVAKLMKVQIGLEQVWRELQRHQQLSSGPGLLVVRNSLRDAQAARGEYARLEIGRAHV